MRPIRFGARGELQLGFTLLEVLVALSLIGVGFSTTFAVVAGIQKLERRASAQYSAMALARATLDEFVETGSIDDGGGKDEVLIGGHKFSYRLTKRSVTYGAALKSDSSSAQILLDRVEIEVYWGELGKTESYRLVTLVSSPKSIRAGLPVSPVANSSPKLK